MKGNPKFAGIQTPLIDTELQQAYDRFLLAIQEASNKDIVKIAEKRYFKTALTGVLENTALHVHIIAKGKEAIIRSSGFTPKFPPVRHTKDKPVSGLRAQGNSAGEVKLSYKTIPSARTHIIEMSTDENNWMMVGNSSSGTAVIRNVPLRQEVLFRVHTIGGGQQKSAPSEVVRVYLF